MLLGAALLLASSSAAASNPKRSCFDDAYCIVVERKADTLHFYIENLLPVEITVRFEADLLNLEPSVPFPHAATYPSVRQTKAFSLALGPGSWHYRYQSTWAYGSLHAQHDDAYVYALPYRPGEAYRVTQAAFGSFSHQTVHAIDFGMPEGTPVLAAREGTVVAAREDGYEAGLEERHKQLDNYVLIRHADGTLARYAHLRQGGVQVAVGDAVAQGDVIGLSGHTGFSKGPHLHFEVYRLAPNLVKHTVPVRFRIGKRKAAALQEGRAYRAVEAIGY